VFSLSGLYEFFETLGHRGQGLAFAVGVVAGGAIGAWICWSLCRRWMPGLGRDKLRVLQEMYDELSVDHATGVAKAEATAAHLESVQKLNTHYLGQIAALEKSLATAAAERDEHQRQMGALSGRLGQSQAHLAEVEKVRESLEAKFTTWLSTSVSKRWGQPVDDRVPKFRPLHSRTMPIISVVNLKGGVGKTTLTANLGATFARRGLRVLMVDLDYQGSLTSRCLSPGEFEDAGKGRRFVHEVLDEAKSDRATAIFRNVVRLEDLDVGPAYLLGTKEEILDEVETRVMAHWLLDVAKDDVRFRLRAALHEEAVQREYDLVLLDCPPRISTGCVNALAASDFALVPVMPESMSVEATPRLLRWIRNFQNTICPDLAILGVVANRVKLHLGKPTREQQLIWDKLKDRCRDVWGSEVKFFDESMIRQFGTLPHRLASLAPEGKAAFDDLADQIWKELPSYARRRVAAVHPIAHPPAPGVRS